ncbi:MAG TPA: NAD(+)/NADH kinase [Ktedonobacteraceae bacterium]|nr:NAD(+)/NADH kinase [Ktedonobacteraceae bacterium]
MVTVGIIANPSSGKDIRRIVAQGWVVSNQEKIAIVRRLLRGLEAAEVDHVLFMPESLGIGYAAMDALQHTTIQAETLVMEVQGRQEDSTHAAEMMLARGSSCLITLGGDGTNRAVFKGCGSRVPILPISTGTNNVFPEFQEGTTAGLAAGMVATGAVSRAAACWQAKVLLVYRGGVPVDLALVDLAISANSVIGARAIWDIDGLSELFLTRAQPWSIGLSAIGGMVQPLDACGPTGLHLIFGEGGRPVRAAIGPGLFATINVSGVQELAVGKRVALHLTRQVSLAFDGERDLMAGPADQLEVELSSDGPWVVDPRRAIEEGVGAIHSN